MGNALEIVIGGLSLAIAFLGAVIGYAAHRLSQQSLFVSLIDRRLSALEAMSTATNQMNSYLEGFRSDNAEQKTMEYGEAIRPFWKAKTDIELLFGNDVVKSVDDLEEAVKAHHRARYDFHSSPRHDQAAYSAVQDAIIEQMEAFSKFYGIAKPYVSLGRLGRAAAPTGRSGDGVRRYILPPIKR